MQAKEIDYNNLNSYSREKQNNAERIKEKNALVSFKNNQVGISNVDDPD